MTIIVAAEMGFVTGVRTGYEASVVLVAALPMQWSPGLQCLPGDQVSDTEARH